MPVARIDDTLDMYYEVDDYTDPWKTPETIILQHGNTRSGKFWWAWVPRLARQYKVVRPDYRGMGRSTVPAPGYQVSTTGLARYLRVLLDQLGLDKVHLVAEAGGGILSMQFAYEYPERLSSLVLCGSAPANRAGAAPATLSFVEQEEKGGTEAFVRSIMGMRFDLSKADQGMVEWYGIEMAKTSHDSNVRMKRYYRDTDLTDILPKIITPTMIMVGELTAFGLGLYKEMHRLIPNSELQIFYGAQHHIAHMYPEECITSTLAFMRRLSL